MIPTIMIGGGLLLAVVFAVRKRVRDFKNHRCCGSCSGCAGGCGNKIIVDK